MNTLTGLAKTAATLPAQGLTCDHQYPHWPTAFIACCQAEGFTPHQIKAAAYIAAEELEAASALALKAAADKYAAGAALLEGAEKEIGSALEHKSPLLEPRELPAEHPSFGAGASRMEAGAAQSMEDMNRAGRAVAAAHPPLNRAVAAAQPPLHGATAGPAPVEGAAERRWPFRNPISALPSAVISRGGRGFLNAASVYSDPSWHNANGQVNDPGAQLLSSLAAGGAAASLPANSVINRSLYAYDLGNGLDQGSDMLGYGNAGLRYVLPGAVAAERIIPKTFAPAGPVRSLAAAAVGEGKTPLARFGAYAVMGLPLDAMAGLPLAGAAVAHLPGVNTAQLGEAQGARETALNIDTLRNAPEGRAAAWQNYGKSLETPDHGIVAPTSGNLGAGAWSMDRRAEQDEQEAIPNSVLRWLYQRGQTPAGSAMPGTWSKGGADGLPGGTFSIKPVTGPLSPKPPDHVLGGPSAAPQPALTFPPATPAAPAPVAVPPAAPLVPAVKPVSLAGVAPLTSNTQAAQFSVLHPPAGGAVAPYQSPPLAGAEPPPSAFHRLMNLQETMTGTGATQDNADAVRIKAQALMGKAQTTMNTAQALIDHPENIVKNPQVQKAMTDALPGMIDAKYPGASAKIDAFLSGKGGAGVAGMLGGIADQLLGMFMNQQQLAAMQPMQKLIMILGGLGILGGGAAALMGHGGLGAGLGVLGGLGMAAGLGAGSQWTGYKGPWETATPSPAPVFAHTGTAQNFSAPGSFFSQGAGGMRDDDWTSEQPYNLPPQDAWTPG